MKKLLIIFIILSSCTTPQSRSNEYYETVIGHIIQTVLSGECNSKCINSIVNSDLKYATYSQAIYVLDQVSKKFKIKIIRIFLIFENSNIMIVIYSMKIASL